MLSGDAAPPAANGTRRTIARRQASAAPRCRPALRSAVAPGRSCPSPATWPPTIGMMSVVVLPTSRKSASGNCLRHERRTRHPVRGRDPVRLTPRFRRRPEDAIRAVDPRLDVWKRLAERVEHATRRPLACSRNNPPAPPSSSPPWSRVVRATQPPPRAPQASRCEFAPERQRALEHRRARLPLLDPSGLDVGAADIPADDRTLHAAATSPDAVNRTRRRAMGRSGRRSVTRGQRQRRHVLVQHCAHTQIRRRQPRVHFDDDWTCVRQYEIDSDVAAKARQRRARASRGDPRPLQRADDRTASVRRGRRSQLS